MTQSPTCSSSWVSLTESELQASDLYQSAVLISENKELLKKESNCTGNCESGKCKGNPEKISNSEEELA